VHEVLLTEDEARHSLEFEDFFVIVPEHPWWKAEKWAGAKSLPDGFRYASNTNNRWLSKEDLQRMMNDIYKPSGIINERRL